jgi:hypothetical protein
MCVMITDDLPTIELTQHRTFDKSAMPLHALELHRRTVLPVLLPAPSAGSWSSRLAPTPAARRGRVSGAGTNCPGPGAARLDEAELAGGALPAGQCGQEGMAQTSGRSVQLSFPLDPWPTIAPGATSVRGVTRHETAERTHYSRFRKLLFAC